jgi:preprotein translocase SecE subunit
MAKGAEKKEKKVKENKLAKKTKETVSELKKVSWPSFGKVVKQTAIVLGVVLFFTVILFGIDRLLSWLFTLLVG